MNAERAVAGRQRACAADPAGLRSLPVWIPGRAAVQGLVDAYETRRFTETKPEIREGA